MRALSFVFASVIAVGLAGCASGGDPSMPDVTGEQLDVARSDIERAGYEDEVDVLGGGVFGILDEGNWMVCEQAPAPGKPLAKAPRLTVERDCKDGTSSREPSPEAEVTAPATPTVAPTPTPTLTLADLEANIADNFGSATWFSSITGYRTLPDGELQVTTSLVTAAESSTRDAQAMCSATTDFFFNQDKDPLVRVTGSDGQVLARRTALNDTCEA